MDSMDAMRALVAASGKPTRQLSEALGRSPNFFSACLSQGRHPGADLLAELAEACGYSLQLVPLDTARPTITVSPRAREGRGR